MLTGALRYTLLVTKPGSRQMYASRKFQTKYMFFTSSVDEFATTNTTCAAFHVDSTLRSKAPPIEFVNHHSTNSLSPT